MSSWLQAGLDALRVTEEEILVTSAVRAWPDLTGAGDSLQRGSCRT